jgi:glycosyltransferase involved in cell wall biosynthesis
MTLPPTRAYAPRWITTPALIADIDLADSSTVLAPADQYRAVRALIRIHGYPVGYADIALAAERVLTHGHVMAALDPDTVQRASEHLIADLEHAGVMLPAYRPCLADLLGLLAEAGDIACTTTTPQTGPFISVAVCTRNRHYSIGATLESLRHQRYDSYEVMVIDNAPADDATERMLREQYPQMRYILEPQPGLDNARNRAMRESRGEIVAFIDDDAIADPSWLQGLAPLFADPQVLCATGLVAPARLETAGQDLFERYGYSKGFRRVKFRLDAPPPVPAFPYKGYIGTGCNCALRRDTLDLVGPFDPGLDMGTPVPGGGDHDMFARIIRAGYTLVYDPAPIVFHQHLADLDVVVMRLGQYQESFWAFMTKAALSDRAYTWPIVRHMLYWYVRKTVRGLGAVAKKRDRPLALVLSEARGALRGPFALLRSHRWLKTEQQRRLGDVAQDPSHIHVL